MCEQDAKLPVPQSSTGSRRRRLWECRDMHMLQHQAGAMVRVDIAKFNAVLDENAVLARELGRAQERSTRLLAEKSSEIAHISMLHLRAQADNIAKESRIGFLAEDLAAAAKALEALAAEPLYAAKAAVRAENTEAQEAPMFPVTLYLNQKKVLCVGGRSGNVASYRDVVERTGAHFAHHDGGLEDSHSVLDASLAAADLVICQTGCISHNAYWKVKEFCKRTGKRCVFVENPSTSSLERGLSQVLLTPAVDAVATP